jgi:hypothetical protein
MLHPALTRALASAHIDDLHRAAGRRHTIRLAHRAAHEPRVAATPTAIQRPASESAASTSCAPAAGIAPAEHEDRRVRQHSYDRLRQPATLPLSDSLNHEDNERDVTAPVA